MTTFKSVSKFPLGFILLGSVAVGAISKAQEFDFSTEINPILIQYDAKTSPGIACEAQAVAEIDEFLNLGFDMFNANPGKRHVVCPIVRDNVKNANGTLGVYVSVHNVANRTLECTLFSADRFGLIIDADVNSTSNSGDQTIYLDVDTSVDRGFYGFNCELANGAAIRSYEWREYLATDQDNSSLIP